MSKETNDWLRNNVLAGFSEKHGATWHALHGLDTKDDNGELTHYTGAIPIDDIIRRLFNFQILESPIKYDAFVNGLEVTIESATDKVVYRDDSGLMLGKFRNGFVIHPYNEWLIDKTSHILDTSKGDLAAANAILLKNGAVAAVQYETPENIKTPEGVEFRPSLLCVTSVDGSLSSTDAMVFTNVVCDNTMSMALSEDFAKAHRFKVKHSKYSNLKLEDMRSALDIYFDAGDDFAAQVKELCETEVSGLQFVKFLTEFNPIPEDEGRAKTIAESKRDQLLTLWMNDNRVEPWAGTAYGVLQLTNTYAQQIAPTNKGTNRLERNMFDVATGKSQKLDASTLETLSKVLANA